MSDVTEFVDDFLAHHGVKGMRWGVRREVKRAGEQARVASLKEGGRSRYRLGLRPRDYGDAVRAEKAARAARKSKRAELRTEGPKPSRSQRRGDKKFERSVRGGKGTRTFIKVHNKAAHAYNDNDVARINNKPKYKAAADRGDFRDGRKPITKQYYQEHQDAFIKRVEEAANSMGTNPSGTRKYGVFVEGDGSWSITTVDVKHAVEDSIIFTVRVVYDDKGQIIELLPANDDLTQTDMFVEDFLEHHGIKGMKWGVRRTGLGQRSIAKAAGKKAQREELTRGGHGREPGIVTRNRAKRLGKAAEKEKLIELRKESAARRKPNEVTVTNKRKKLKTSGGYGHKPAAEAVRARKIGQVASKSGVHALTNAELKDYQTRLQLEQNVKRLQYNEKPAAQRWIARTLGRAGDQTAQSAANEGARRAGKKALTFAGVVEA